MEKSQFYFQITPTSGVPIYRQLMDQVKNLIARGELTEGTFLPSTREVAQQLELNHMTVSKAYALLEKEMVVKHVRGKGVAVISSSIPKKHIKEQKEALDPLLYEVVKKALQLSLSLKDVLDYLENIWKENSNV